MNKSRYINSASYRAEHTLGYKIVMGSVALIIAAATMLVIVWG